MATGTINRNLIRNELQLTSTFILYNLIQLFYKTKILQSGSTLHCKNTVLITSRVMCYEVVTPRHTSDMSPSVLSDVEQFQMFLTQLQLNHNSTHMMSFLKEIKNLPDNFLDIFYTEKGLPQCAPTLTDFLYPANSLAG